MLSGLKDVDREILKHADDKELLKICSIDKKMWNEVCDDNFLKRRLSKYVGIDRYKKEKESYKQFFLRFVYHKFKMREKYRYEYKSGDFEKQYKILQNAKSANNLLVEAIQTGELDLAKHAVTEGANIFEETILLRAVLFGHLDIVKWLVSSGVDLYSDINHLLIWAAKRGHLNIVKHLIEQGADIHAGREAASKQALLGQHLDLAKWLLASSANLN